MVGYRRRWFVITSRVSSPLRYAILFILLLLLFVVNFEDNGRRYDIG